MIGSSLRKTSLRSGASAPSSRSVGRSWSATGIRSLISGCVSFAKTRSRLRVRRDSSRKVGKIEIVSASASSREATASKNWFAFPIRSRRLPRRSVSAFSVMPVFFTSRLRAGSWSSRILRTFEPAAAKSSRLPIALLRSSPRPSRIAIAISRIQPWKFLRVSSSNSEMISSSSTDSTTASDLMNSPSSSFGPSRVPGVSSM
jgi:hypothetical protein